MIVRTTTVRPPPMLVTVCALAVLVPLLVAQPSAATWTASSLGANDGRVCNDSGA